MSVLTVTIGWPICMWKPNGRMKSNSNSNSNSNGIKSTIISIFFFLFFVLFSFLLLLLLLICVLLLLTRCYCRKFTSILLLFSYLNFYFCKEIINKHTHTKTSTLPNWKPYTRTHKVSLYKFICSRTHTLSLPFFSCFILFVCYSFIGQRQGQWTWPNVILVIVG